MSFSEGIVDYNQSTRGHIPEDWNLHHCFSQHTKEAVLWQSICNKEKRWVFPKELLIITNLHGVISQKTGIYISVAETTPTILVNQMFAGRPVQWLLTANSWKLNQVAGVGKMLWVWSNSVRGFGVCFFSNVSQGVNSTGMCGAVTVLCVNL